MSSRQMSTTAGSCHAPSCSKGVQAVNNTAAALTQQSKALPPAGVLAYVYIGSLANNVGEIAAGRTKVSPAVTIVSAILSGVFIIGAMVLVTFYARRAIMRSAPEHTKLTWRNCEKTSADLTMSGNAFHESMRTTAGVALGRVPRRLEQEHSVEESFAVDVVDQDVQEAERLIQRAERHV